MRTSRPQTSGTNTLGRRAPVPDDHDQPLSRPPDDAGVLQYRAELAAVRGFAADWGRRAGLLPHQAVDLVIVVGELTANTLTHTGGPGVLRLWVSNGEVICQVEDGGQIGDPTAGTQLPDPAAGGGRGLWVVRQLSERVEIRTGSAGTAVRVQLRRDPGPG